MLPGIFQIFPYPGGPSEEIGRNIAFCIYPVFYIIENLSEEDKKSFVHVYAKGGYINKLKNIGWSSNKGEVVKS
jgi:hypothetical protein